MKIIIIGSKGQLGRELINKLENKNYKFKAFDLPKLDITNFKETSKIISNYSPEIIINCAAYTNVDDCEKNKDKAFKVNAVGPKNLAIIAQNNNSKLIHISTDYVFKGDNFVPYKEYDNPNPQTIYGKSKLLGEEYVREFVSEHFIFRTAWLYGKGNNFVNTMMKLGKNKKEINVVNDQIGSPTSTKELSKVIINLMETENYGLYHGTCKGKCSWYDLAKKTFDILDYDIQINPIPSKEYKTKTPRPKYSVLENYMLKLIDENVFKNWERALEEYIKMEVF